MASTLQASVHLTHLRRKSMATFTHGILDPAQIMQLPEPRSQYMAGSHQGRMATITTLPFTDDHSDRQMPGLDNQLIGRSSVFQPSMGQPPPHTFSYPPTDSDWYYIKPVFKQLYV